MGVPLEQTLAAQGFTLGHFPSSILCSTVGGWVATRSAGQCSGAYGKIEDMVASLECVTGAGDIVELRRRSGGPDLVPLVVGSEGTLAIVTSARLRLHPAPTSRGVRRVVVSDDRAWAGGDARASSRPACGPRSPASTIRSTRCWRSAEGVKAADAGDARRHAPGRGGAALRGVLRRPALLNELLTPRVAARALGGAMLVVIFEGAGEAPQRGHRGRAPPRRGEPWRRMGRARRPRALARAPLRGQLPAGARLRERSLRRHDGGRGLVVEARRALRGRAARARRARVRHGALQPRVSGRVLRLLLVRGQRGAARARARMGRGVRGDLRPRLAGRAAARRSRRGDPGAPPRRRPIEGAATARRARGRHRRRAGPDAGVRPGRHPEPGEPHPARRPRPRDLSEPAEPRPSSSGSAYASTAVEIDRESLLVRAGGDVDMAALEAQLRSAGLTLDVGVDGPGSSVGDWLARGAPGARDRWLDPADQLLAGLEATLVDGRRLRIRPAPRRAVGPDLSALFVGAGGRFGRIDCGMASRTSARGHASREHAAPARPRPARLGGRGRAARRRRLGSDPPRLRPRPGGHAIGLPPMT